MGAVVGVVEDVVVVVDCVGFGVETDVVGLLYVEVTVPAIGFCVVWGDETVLSF